MTNLPAEKQDLNPSMEVTVVTRSKLHVPEFYYMVQITYECQSCGSTTSMLSGKMFLHVKGKNKDDYDMPLEKFHGLLRTYRGPQAQLPELPLKLKPVTNTVDMCPDCVGQTFGTGDDPHIPLASKMTVADLYAKRDKMLRAAKAKRAKKPVPLSDEDFFNV